MNSFLALGHRFPATLLMLMLMPLLLAQLSLSLHACISTSSHAQPPMAMAPMAMDEPAGDSDAAALCLTHCSNHALAVDSVPLLALVAIAALPLMLFALSAMMRMEPARLSPDSPVRLRRPPPELRFRVLLI